MDDLDKRLISLLHEGTPRSGNFLAKELGISPATVRRRIRRLIKEKVLRIQAVIDPDKIGLPLAVVIAFDVAHESLDSVMSFLAKQPPVRWVASCTGRFDVIVLAQFASTEELSEFMAKKMLDIDGVTNSETFICLHVEKPRFWSTV